MSQSATFSTINLEQIGPSSSRVVQSVAQVGNNLFSIRATGPSGEEEKTVLNLYNLSGSETAEATQFYISDKIGHQGLTH